MLDFLSTYGIEVLLILYGIVTTFLNVITYRRTGKLYKSTDNCGSTDSSKLAKKLDKARTKLEKLITKAVEINQSEDETDVGSE